MKTEDQYIQEKFYKNFIEGDCRNIVIYGTGIHTKKLLENIKTNRIVGLMDAAKTGEVMYGKKVLSNQETAAIRDVAIVIVARSSVIYVIYRRIQEFVTKNGIPVYDINGRQLVPEDINMHARECFQLKEKDLVSIIDDMAVVTFDIFDTLLCRTVLRPTDVFRLMDEKAGDKPYLFSEERVKAEQELGITNYNLDEIYHQIMENNGESEEEIRRLKELEIETETRVLRKRNTMCELLEYAHRQGKKVYLLSDMYISGEIIKEILYKKGIEHYDGLYVSTDYRTSKEEGLFEILKKENKIEVSEWLHIGDNPVSDINTAAKSGIKAYRIYGTVEMLEDVKRKKLSLDWIREELSVTEREVKEFWEEEGDFQRFVTGKRSSMAEMRDKIGCRVMRPQDWLEKYQDSQDVNRVQIYEDRGQGYNEEDSYFVREAYQGDWLIELELKVGGDVKMLRIDPGMYPCAVKIREMTFNGATVPLHRRKLLYANGSIVPPADREGEKDCPSIVFATEDPNINVNLERLERKEENVLRARLEIVRLPLQIARDMENRSRRRF